MSNYERLGLQIMPLFCERCSGYDPDFPEDCGAPDDPCKVWIEGIITRIVQAIENGELMLTKIPPKLPDEVGRWIPASAGGDEAGGGFARRILKEIGRAPILIALRPCPKDSGEEKEEP